MAYDKVFFKRENRERVVSTQEHKKERSQRHKRGKPESVDFGNNRAWVQGIGKGQWGLRILSSEQRPPDLSS